MPILTASKLLSSMCFQSSFGLATYTKEKRVGTLVLAFCALCLIEVGPEDPAEPPDAEALLMRPVAQAWLFIMAVVLVGSLTAHVRCSREEEEHAGGNLEMALLSVVVAVSTALGASVGKLLSLTEGAALAASIACYLGCGVLSFAYAALAAFHCDQSVFLPVSECLQLLVNCATGLFIWGDGQRMHSGLSYAMVYCIICLGVYLCTSVDVVAQPKQRERGNKVLSPAVGHGVALPCRMVAKVVSRKELSSKLVAASSKFSFKLQKRVLADAFEFAKDKEAFLHRLRRELKPDMGLGRLVVEDIEALSSMLQDAARVASKVLEEVKEGSAKSIRATVPPSRPASIPASFGGEPSSDSFRMPLLQTRVSASNAAPWIS